MSSDDVLTIQRIESGAVWRVVLSGSIGNILDGRLVDALSAVFRDAPGTPHLKAICLEGQGAHFSYGASVPEHLPAQAADMLQRFHGMLLALLDSSVVVLAAVRGQCLGGGLELVTLCHRVFASQDARFGQPEIQLGVFAPAASLLLAERVGRRHAEDLCLTGRIISAHDALAMGLVDQVAHTDPADAALDWVRAHLLRKSASSLRYAVSAIRMDLRARLVKEMPCIERLYLDGLMGTADAVEGLDAFIAKRRPVWSDQ